ncbi:hypothetical protein ACFHW2_11770 [Actinomadura sp. LOL_016]|uniref:hypothetical protein n=1 Tax=unclassified Actinomadura TaxID=2626254 RepID=UPI003A7F89A0
MEGRIYQASLEASLDIAEPEGRIYQASLQVTDPAVALTGRIYQASITAAASSTGTGRIYQASLTAALDIVPSGITVRRGANLAALTVGVYRQGAL